MYHVFLLNKPLNITFNSLDSILTYILQEELIAIHGPGCVKVSTSLDMDDVICIF